MRTSFLLAVAMLAAAAAGSAAAQTESLWDIEAVDGSCRVVQMTPDDAPAGAAEIHGFRWDPQQQVVWSIFAEAGEGAQEGEPINLKISSAAGPGFSGPAAHFVAEDIQGYALTTPDRKDVSVVLSGDITFTYEGLNGRPVSHVVPLARQLPRIRKCMSQARAQAKQIAEGGRPTRQASAPPSGSEGGARRPTGEPELTSFGSGVFINARGQLLTNAHVVDGCRMIGNETIGAGKLIAVDPGSDLALLQFDTKPRGFVSLRSANLKLGEGVIAAGFPLSDLLANGLNVTTGNVSALSGIQGDRRRVQITTPLQPGNSGGPLLDSSGRLVGVVSSGLRNEMAGEGRATAQNVNYAIAPFIVQAFLQEHEAPFNEARDSRETTESIAAKARAYTVRLECWS